MANVERPASSSWDSRVPCWERAVSEVASELSLGGEVGSHRDSEGDSVPGSPD